VLSVAVLLCAATAGTAVAGEWPTRWQVNGNGVTGVLELSIREDGSLIGRLMDEYVEGYVSGRHLFIRRTAENRAEIWEGWLGTESSLIVAGTISVEEAGRTVVYPWFGRPDVATQAASAPAPATEETLAAPSRPPGGPLSGTWESTTGGEAEIVQDGKNLTVTLADGSPHSGRMTGDSTLVVGLRKGCCNGELEGPDVIVWSDGARWQRAD